MEEILGATGSPCMNRRNSWNDLLERMSYVASSYAKASDTAFQWYREHEPNIRRAFEVGSTAIEALPVWLAISSLTFGRGGWSELPLSSMTLPEYSGLVERLMDKPDEEVKRELDEVIPEYFRREGYAPLSEMVEEWQEHFGERYHIFEDALWAHEQGRYTLSIPALATQVEGIVRDLTGEVGGTGRSWIMRFNTAFGFDYKPWDPPPLPDPDEVLNEIRALPWNERYEKASELKTFFTLLRINELHDHEPEPHDFEFASSKVNRHVIAHGRVTSFSEIDSLRLFCILALLHDAVDAYKKIAGFDGPISPQR
ncbi:MAG: hypothetical protein M3P49_14105 [Actinomycetota bacterium]|nr:hypothetical protein [Actinomycetota bacterium]